MKRIVAVALLASGVAFTGAMAAQPVNLSTKTAGELADLCASPPMQPGTDAKINFCRGFAQGAITVKLDQAADTKPFCFPNPSPSRAKTMSDFVAWVKAVPDRRTLPSADGLFRFLGERYPCK
jgi:hypothetical protein